MDEDDDGWIATDEDDVGCVAVDKMMMIALMITRLVRIYLNKNEDVGRGDDAEDGIFRLWYQI